MEDSSIRLSREALIKLKKSKTKFRYKTMEELLIGMNNFFIENALIPTEKVDYNLISTIQEIKTDFKNRDDSLRKWIGKITNVDLSSMYSVMYSMKELLEYQNQNLIQQTIDVVKQINPNVSIEKKEEVVQITTPTDDNSTYKKIIEQKNKTIVFLNSSLKELLKNKREGKNSEVYYLEVSRELFYKIEQELNK